MPDAPHPHDARRPEPQRPHSPEPRATPGRGARTLLVVAAGAVGAALFGVTNWLVSLRDGTADDLGTGWTIGSAIWFGIIGAAFAAGLAWAVLIGRRRPEARAATAKDSIERSLQQRAASGAFVDLVIVAGLANLATGLLALDWSAAAALSLVTALGLLDFAVRFFVLRSRES